MITAEKRYEAAARWLSKLDNTPGLPESVEMAICNAVAALAAAPAGPVAEAKEAAN